MPGCAAVGCLNSAKKGYIMKKFPKDSKRREEWAIEAKLDKWFITDSSVLCEVHFEPEMWEKTRADGSRKLKARAVPSIFNISKKTEFFSTQIPLDHSFKEATSQSAMVVLENFSSESTISSNEKKVFEKLSKREQLNIYSKLCKRKSCSSKNYKNKLRCAELKIKRLQQQLKVNSRRGNGELTHKIFHQDQLLALKKKNNGISTKFMKWSNETITKAFELKFACGGAGYEKLLSHNLPYPSIRTLQRRLQNLKFDSGILTEVFTFLKIKVQTFNEAQKDCVLILDEMAITPGKCYDTSMNKYFGDVTLPDHRGVATHVLVFMLAGINTRWKQVVAYYFTGNSVAGSVFKNIIDSIFEKAAEINLNIISITSDMGACNQALWRTMQVTAGRHKIIRNSICNPIDPEKKVFFLADVPHLFKNLKSMLVNNKIISVSKSIQERYNLPTQIINVQHIFDLVEFQNELGFSLAPKLSQEDLLPTHYDKMKVSKSTHVISQDVSSALKFVSQHLNRKEFNTTAWFIDQVEKWFYLMTSRHPVNAISKHNVEIYDQTITFLKDFMEIIDSMEVGIRKIWKPCQTGILLSTKSMLNIQKYLIETQNYHFVLTSRFSQDCLENLFSVLRSKQIVPNALQVKNNLKLISVSQYLKCPKGSSYEEDDRVFLSDFLDVIKKPQSLSYRPVELPENINSVFNLNYSEMNSLYNIAGYIISSIKKTSKTCEVCIASVGSKYPIEMVYTKLTVLKCYRQNTLFFCHEHVMYFFIDMESIFRAYYDIVSPQNIDVKLFFINQMKEHELFIENCHQLKRKIITRFVTFRLKIASKKKQQIANRFASKSLRK